MSTYPILDTPLQKVSCEFIVHRDLRRDTYAKQAVDYAKASAMSTLEKEVDEWRRQNNYHGKVVILVDDWDISREYPKYPIDIDDYDEVYRRCAKIYAAPLRWHFDKE